MHTLEIIIAVFASVFATSGFWSYLQYRSCKRDVRTEMLIGLGHDRIIYLGMSYLARGWVTQAEYENLREYLFKPYNRMGGNGSAEKIIQEVDKLPIRQHVSFEAIKDDRREDPK